MPRNILVISNDQSLINTISAHIEQGSVRRAFSAKTDEEALHLVAGRKIEVVIIDVDGCDFSLLALTNDIIEIQPDIRIILFPPQNNPLHPDLEEVTSSAILQKPFSAAELDAVLARIFPEADEKDQFFLEETLDEDEKEEGFSPNSFIDEAELRNLDDLLNSMPPPDPEDGANPDQSKAKFEPIPESEGEMESDSFSMDEAESDSIGEISAEYPAENKWEKLFSEDQEPELPWEEILSNNKEGAVSPPLPKFVDSTLSADESIDSAHARILSIDTRTVSTPEAAPGTSPLGLKSIRFEYYCVLIPNDSNQYLARDISDRLGFILPQIHISRGWKVTSLSVRPMFLMWQVSLPADICPANAVNEIRSRTSAHFRTNFPDLLAGKNDEDFWAPGYLILSGPQAPSNALINGFIQRIRSAQQEHAR